MSERRVAKHGETLQSHVLNLFFLAAPDFLGLPSAIPLVDSRPDLVHLALRLKSIGNRVCDVVAGRTTHPVSLQVGGVAKVPKTAELRRLRSDLTAAVGDLDEAAAFLASVELPDFERETEWVSLGGDGDYPFIGGRLISSDGVERDEDDYLGMTNEYLVEGDTSKRTRLSREDFAVGPLARVNNNFELLHPEARRLASRFGLEPICPSW